MICMCILLNFCCACLYRPLPRHTINKSGTDGTHTHKDCDMHMHSIKLQNLFFMFVQAIDLMYRLSMYYPLYKYSFRKLLFVHVGFPYNWSFILDIEPSLETVHITCIITCTCTVP